MLIAPRLLWSIQPFPKGLHNVLYPTLSPVRTAPAGPDTAGGPPASAAGSDGGTQSRAAAKTAPPRSRQRRLISASAKDGTFPPFPGGAELALSPPFRVGLNWHFPPLSGWGKPPAAASESSTRAASRPPPPRRRRRRRSPGPRLAQTRRQRVRSGRESGRNSPEYPHSLSKSEDSGPHPTPKKKTGTFPLPSRCSHRGSGADPGRPGAPMETPGRSARRAAW